MGGILAAADAAAAVEALLTVPPIVKHQDLFLKLQWEAREAGRGLWKSQRR